MNQNTENQNNNVNNSGPVLKPLPNNANQPEPNIGVNIPGVKVAPVVNNQPVNNSALDSKPVINVEQNSQPTIVNTVPSASDVVQNNTQPVIPGTTYSGVPTSEPVNSTGVSSLKPNTLMGNQTKKSVANSGGNLKPRSFDTLMEEGREEREKEIDAFENDITPVKGRWGYRIIIILLLAIIGGGVYYFGFNTDGISMYQKLTGINKSTAGNVIDTKDLGRDNYLVKTLYNRMHYTTDLKSEALLYINDVTNANSLDSDYLNNIILQEASREKLDNFNTYTKDELNTARDIIFGKKTNITIFATSIGSCPKYEYDSNSDSFINTNNTCVVSGDKLVDNYITKANSSGDNIYIYEAVAFRDQENKKLYKTMDENYNFSDELEGTTFDTFDITKEYDKAEQYKYTFIYNAANDNYVFDTLERVK